MNLTNKKVLILSLPMILAVFLLGGWFLFREQKVSEESPKTPVVGENPTQNPGENPPNDAPIVKSLEAIRDEKILSLLAQENGESEGGVRLSYKSVTEHHVEGLATLESDSRKRISFFATDVLPYSNQQGNRELKYGIWTIIDRDFATCELMSKYSFPEKMAVGCTEGKRGNLKVSELWRRVSGNPKEDCSDHIYEGKVVVRGWYEWRMNYVERDWMLVVDKSDESKLIVGFSRSPSFQLRNVSPELEEALKNATPNKPVAITVKRLGYYCEGSPWLEL